MADARGTVRFTTRSGMSVERRGSGRPVVLVHGWCLSRELWRYAEEHLLPDHDVITVDLPGFGASDGLAGPYGLERHANELEGLLEELDLAEALVVGFAFGASVGMELARSRPARLGGLLLVGVPSAEHAAFDRMPRAMRKDWPVFARRSAQAICNHPISEESLRWLADMFARTPLPVALKTAEVISAFEPFEVAAEIAVPTLFVHGEQDQVTPPDVAHHCAAAMETAAVEVVSDCGHLAVIDDREQFHVTLAAFVDDPAGTVARIASA